MNDADRLGPGPWSASANPELVSSPLLPAPISRPQRPSLRASDATWGKQGPVAPMGLPGAWPTRPRLAFPSQEMVQGGNLLLFAFISIWKEPVAMTSGGSHQLG